ncbi:hypothetical protein, partial [Escherichia coli]|uniref:hypothetical protein n=1 Tax=Escherichia coli TaxID=562 RepID=UPI001BC89AEE
MIPFFVTIQSNQVLQGLLFFDYIKGRTSATIHHQNVSSLIRRSSNPGQHAQAQAHQSAKV